MSSFVRRNQRRRRRGINQQRRLLVEQLEIRTLLAATGIAEDEGAADGTEVAAETISDFVWEDLNVNGIQEGGEPGIPSVTVNLRDVTGANVLQTTSTDPNGLYSFFVAPDTSYVVEFVAPFGFNFTLQDVGGNDAIDSDANPATGRTAPVFVGPSDTLTNVDAGLFTNVSIHGRKFKDLDANGQRDPGDPYLNGWEIILFDENGNAVDRQVTHDHDISGDQIIDPETERGWYWFVDHPPGHYTVGEIIPPDDHWIQTTPMAPPDDGLLDPGFDLFMTDPANTHVFLDLTTFGGPPIGEVQLQGVPLGPGGTDTIVRRLDPADVDEVGEFATVEIELVALHLQSVQPVDIQGELFDVQVIGGSELGVTQLPGPGGEQPLMSINRTHEFGGTFNSQLPVTAEITFLPLNTQLEPIGPIPFNDVFTLPAVGVWSLEPSAGDPRIVDEDLETSRPSGGFYPGVDHSQGICPPVKVLTQEEALLAAHGVLPAMLMDAVAPGVHHLWLDSGTIFSDVDFGNTKKGSIHAYKFDDRNANGTDDGEPRLAGVEFTLTGIDGMGKPVGPLTTFSDANGEIWFENLKPGVYTLTETVPAGSRATTPTQVTVTVLAGQEYVGLDGQSRHLKEHQTLRPTYVPGDGYLEFINATEHPGLLGTPVPSSPPGVINTEEYTGYTLDNGLDIIEFGDTDTTAGDKADFDWVQEHRADEAAGLGNHPGLTGAMGWTADTPELSPHLDPGPGGGPHGHSLAELPPGTLPELENEAYTERFFAAVDVFSIISIGEDSDTDDTGTFSPREAALDYVVDFVNTATGVSSPGVLVDVWVPGWTGATTIDDYVARWVPALGGVYDFVGIEPASGPFDDQITEIDAVKALPHAKEEILDNRLAFGNTTTTDEIGVRREETFYLDVNGSGGWNPGIDRVIPFGLASDTPVIGDWNGDGVDEIGVRRGDTFYLDVNGNGGWDPLIDRSNPFGFASDTPVVGDWNGDGVDEIGVRRGDTFYLDLNGNGGWDTGVDAVIPFGFASDTPITGDWNGDGVDEIGVRRDEIFYLDQNGSGNWNAGIDRVIPFGLASDTPLIGDWNGDGVDEIGVRRNETFYLDQNGSGGWNPGVDRVIPFGLASDTPLIGNWQADGPLKGGLGKSAAIALPHSKNSPVEAAIPGVINVSAAGDGSSVYDTPAVVSDFATGNRIISHESWLGERYDASYDELIDDLEAATRGKTSADTEAVDALFSSKYNLPRSDLDEDESVAGVGILARMRAIVN